MSDSEVTVVPANAPKPVGRPKGTGGSYTKRKFEILQIIQRAVYEKYGIEDWHPIKEMALYAADPNRVTVLMDKDGNPLFDKNGQPVLIEHVDPSLRIRCLEQLAQYVAPKLKSVELTPAAMGERFTLNYSVIVEGSTE